MQLTTAEQNIVVRKKLVDLESKRFIVLERHNNTYKLKEKINPTGRIRQRHFNELEPAPRPILSWETSETDDSNDSRESSCNSEDEQPPPRQNTTRM